MNDNEKGMKVYNRILESARRDNKIPKDTRGYWNYMPKGYTPPPKPTKAEMKAKKAEERKQARAIKKQRKYESGGKEVGVNKTQEDILREKLKKQKMKALGESLAQDSTAQYKSAEGFPF